MAEPVLAYCNPVCYTGLRDGSNVDRIYAHGQASLDRHNRWPEGPVAVVCGATATGKTGAAIALAERIGGEIINADSMQVYRGMDIGTAKPTAAERRKTPFHLLDIAAPDCQLSVADWKKLAEDAILAVSGRKRIPIICGGTGLYLKALLDDWSLAGTPASEQIRMELMGWCSSNGAPWLHERLREVDPVTAERLHANDSGRVIRALEVYLTGGVPISALQAADRASRCARGAVRWGLTLDKEALNARIDSRADAMLRQGFVNEVEGLLKSGYAAELGPMKSLGYREIASYLTGKISYESAVAEMKANTRRFAKRQQTWFRADPLVRWIDVSALSSAEVAVQLHAELMASAKARF